MSGFQTTFDALKEPLGFIKVLEWIFAIFAFATCGVYTGTTEIKAECQNGTESTLSATFSYPFKLNSVKLEPESFCNSTVNQYLKGDFSSSAQFFVTVAVFAFLYCMAALVYYVGFLHLYRNTKMLPMIDFGVTVIFIFLWLVSASAWAKGLTDVKIDTASDTIIKHVAACNTLRCTQKAAASMAKLNVSVVFGFLNMTLWGGNAWFVYKETSFHTTPQPTVQEIPENAPPPAREM